MSLKLKIKIPAKREVKSDIQLATLSDNRTSINEIIDNIFISGYQVANDQNFLQKNSFTHVINCSYGSSLLEVPGTNLVNQSKKNNKIIGGIKYLSIFLHDDPSVDIIHNILQAIDFIESDFIDNNKKILFHCVEGISRGPAITAGYLMWKKNLTKQQAINLISIKRKNVDINLGFSLQLEKWEKYLNRENDVNIFKLNQGIKLLDESEFQNEENFYESDFLFRYKEKFIFIKGGYYEENKENEEVNEFIENIQKYDKCLEKRKNNNDGYYFINNQFTVVDFLFNYKSTENKINDFISFFKEQFVGC